MRKLFIFALFVVLMVSMALADSPYVGTFARMGYGATGMGMGNSLVAVSDGDISTYYNPALAPFAQMHTVSASFGILSLDRTLNFLSYTQPINPTGGFSVGLINAGVHNIDGRNSDGVHTEDLSTFENQFYLAFANQLSENVSIGVAIKMYYSKLYDKVTSSTVGFDIGGLFHITPELTLGATIQDINSKYKWPTSNVLSTDGTNPTDHFPLVRKIGLAYNFKPLGLIVSGEYENTSASINSFRMGAEYFINPNFTLRAGLDRWETGSNTAGAEPTFGFTVQPSQTGMMAMPVLSTLSLSYAFIFEPFSSSDIHVITLSSKF